MAEELATSQAQILALLKRGKRLGVHLEPNAMTDLDQRKHLADLWTELGISRSTFYDWRATHRAPRCIKLPNGALRSAGRTSSAGSRAARFRMSERTTTSDVRIRAPG